MRYLLLCVLAAAVLLAASTDSRALLNPHIKPEPCESCHTKVPTEADGSAGDYFLLKDSIDDTCHFHTKPDGSSFKMVRIVKIDGKMIDWTNLCRDCHMEY